MHLEIESNIPLPPRTNYQGSIYKNLAKKMSVGDSVVVKNQIEAKNLYQAIKALNGKSATRQVRKGGEVRVWRF